MIRVTGRTAVYGEVWYDEELPRDPGVDIVLYRQRETPIADARTTPFLTMVTDLSTEADAIAEKFGKDCRYKIRRAETKDGLRMEFITDPESRLDEFRAFYDAFARQKSLGPCNRQWLLAACKARQLALSSAAQNGEALVWHAHVISGSTAGLQVHGLLFQKQGKRLPRPGRASQSLASLGRHAALQGDGNTALRLGWPLRGRIHTGARRDQQLQEGLRRAAGTYLRLHSTGDHQRPHLSCRSRCLAPPDVGSGIQRHFPAAVPSLSTSPSTAAAAVPPRFGQ